MKYQSERFDYFLWSSLIEIINILNKLSANSRVSHTICVISRNIEVMSQVKLADERIDFE